MSQAPMGRIRFLILCTSSYAVPLAVEEPAGRPRPRFARGRGKSGLHRAGCWGDSGGGDLAKAQQREDRPLRGVRVKRCGKSAPAARATAPARQAPPGARPSRQRSRVARPSCRVGRTARENRDAAARRETACAPREMAAAGTSVPVQDPAYRPAPPFSMGATFALARSLLEPRTSPTGLRSRWRALTS